MNIHDQRFSKVPWLFDSDLAWGADPLWQIDKADEERASAWKIDGESDYLILRAIRGNGNDGGRITLALSPTPRYDVYAKVSFTIRPSQSNPRRYEDDGDGA